jgi:uncharacterized membrane protein
MENQEVVLYTVQDVRKQEGMLFVRIKDILIQMLKAPLVAVTIILTVVLPAQHSFGSLRNVEFFIYPDGTTHVSQESSADPQIPELVVPLFGSSIDNFFAQDENGLLLSYEIGRKDVTINTLGATTISIDYDSYDLVSKKGKIWTFMIDSPIAYTVTIPQEATIVGMSNPELLETSDGSRVSFMEGENEINYISADPADRAQKAIDDAKTEVEQTNGIGISTPLAQAKLDQAIDAFEKKLYGQAQNLAGDAIDLAKDEALAAQKPTTQSPLPIPPDLPGIIALIAGLGGAITTISLIVKRTKSMVKKTIEPLLEKNEQEPETLEQTGSAQDMRDDDKQLVSFLEQNGGQAFEKDMRKKFLLPRTTMWRAVKRLERQGIIEIEKKDFQNLVRLKKKPEGEK